MARPLPRSAASPSATVPENRSQKMSRTKWTSGLLLPLMLVAAFTAAQAQGKGKGGENKPEKGQGSAKQEKPGKAVGAAVKADKPDKPDNAKSGQALGTDKQNQGRGKSLAKGGGREIRDFG